MPEQPKTLQVLTRVPTEMEASLVVLRLADQGIAATAVGGFTAGFRAEAPGMVAVMVNSADLPAAEAALAAIEAERSSEQAADEDASKEEEGEEPEEEAGDGAEADAEPPLRGGMPLFIPSAITVLLLILLAIAAIPPWLATAAILGVWLVFLLSRVSKSAPPE